MHERILTQREKEEAEKYLESGQASPFIYTLKFRARKFLPTLKEDVETLEHLLEDKENKSALKPAPISEELGSLKTTFKGKTSRTLLREARQKETTKDEKYKNNSFQ